MASSPLTGGTWCLSSRNHRFYRKITKNESRRTINDKPTVLLFMQKDDIMLFLTAVSDFGEKLVGYQISFPGHQISMFWVCGFPTTQRVSVWRPGNSDYYTSRGSVTLFLCSGCHYSTISLHTNQLLCVCVCVVCLPVVLHYPAVLCSSSGERRLWIPLSASAVTLHPPLVAAEHHPRYHHHQLSYFYFCTPL